MAKSIRSGDPDNLEAQAARVYWSQLFGERGFSRDSAQSTGRNALLNFGYMVLRGSAVRAVTSAGLAPAIGVFHRGRSNAFNLADDLIEPFRAAVDWVVHELGPSAKLDDRAVKAALVAASQEAPFSKAGYSPAAALTALAQQLGRYVEGEVDRLAPPSWTGPAGYLND